MTDLDPWEANALAAEFGQAIGLFYASQEAEPAHAAIKLTFTDDFVEFVICNDDSGERAMGLVFRMEDFRRLLRDAIAKSEGRMEE